MKLVGVVGWVGMSCLVMPGAAKACGGGGVVSSTGSVGANAQRVFLSLHGDGVAGGPAMTDVVVQIAVPSTTSDYGALLPLPLEPKLDTIPVAVEDFDALDEATAPQILTVEGSDGGFSCGCVAGSAADTKSSSARVSAPVAIGPVTATVLTGTTVAVNDWLTENGFAISDADRATIEDYAGYYFVAIKRGDTTAPGGPSSIGIHFTMMDDHRSCRFTSRASGRRRPSPSRSLSLPATSSAPRLPSCRSR